MKKYFSNIDPAQRRAGGRIIKFLALMLVFTIVARGADGATLARVSLATPGRTDIVDTISGQATVSVVDTYEISAIEKLTIAEMHAIAGQYLAIGDAIATFMLCELEEMHIRETATLNRMRHDLDLLHRNNGTDSGSLETARRNLRRAQDDYDNVVRQGQEDINDAMQELTTLLESSDTSAANSRVFRDHMRAVEDYASTLARGQANIEDAQATLNELLLTAPDTIDDSALQTAIRNHERNLQDYDTTVAQGQTDIANAQETLDDLRAQRPEAADRTAIDAAQRVLNRAREDRESTRLSNERSIYNAQVALDNAWVALEHAVVSGDEELVAARWASVQQAETALEAAQNTAASNMLPRTRAVEDAERDLAQAQRNLTTANETELERLEGEIELAETALANAITRAAEQRLIAMRNKENTEATLAQTQRTFDNSVSSEAERFQNAITAARDELEAAETRAAADLSTAARILEDATHALNTELERADTDVVQAQADIQDAITRAENNRRREARNVEDRAADLRMAEQAHFGNLQQTADSTRLDMITATTLPLDIANQESLIRELAQIIENNGVIYAETAGQVSAALQQGDTVGTAPVVTLQIVNGGFEARIQIPQRDAERLTIGSVAEVTTSGGSMFFIPTETAVVSAISAPDDDNMVDVTLRLPGTNWNIGQRTDVEIVLSRASYDISVPISALRSDDAGYFVYVVEQRSTVLGVQNVIARANVTVNAYDSNNVSVSGPVWRQSQVITGSNKAISAGDRVRVNS